MALCVFMLAVLIFNPFGFVINKFPRSQNDYVPEIPGRTLFQKNG